MGERGPPGGGGASLLRSGPPLPSPPSTHRDRVLREAQGALALVPGAAQQLDLCGGGEKCEEEGASA